MNNTLIIIHSLGYWCALLI